MDVSSRLAGQVRASYVEGPRRISDGLVLEPRQEENYYEASLVLFCLWFVVVDCRIMKSHALGSEFDEPFG